MAVAVGPGRKGGGMWPGDEIVSNNTVYQVRGPSALFLYIQLMLGKFRVKNT